MRDPDKISRAKAKHNYKEMINAGWEFLAPAWRGVQDSASYPAFRYYYASMADELRSPANKSRLLAFYVKEEPVERSQEWLRGVKFTPMNRLDKLVNYKEGDLSRLPKQIYIVRVTGESIHLYSVFDTRLNVESPFESIEGCFCVYLSTQINPEALHPVDFSTAFIAPGAENGPSVAACEEAFAESRRLKAHKLTVDWLTYYVCHEDGGYHTEDKCDPAYVPSPPSDAKFAANRRRKGITSLSVRSISLITTKRASSGVACLWVSSVMRLASVVRRGWLTLGGNSLLPLGAGYRTLRPIPLFATTMPRFARLLSHVSLPSM